MIRTYPQIHVLKIWKNSVRIFFYQVGYGPLPWSPSLGCLTMQQRPFNLQYVPTLHSLHLKNLNLPWTIDSLKGDMRPSCKFENI